VRQGWRRADLATHRSVSSAVAALDPSKLEIEIERRGSRLEEWAQTERRNGRRK
jgi:hypothetical protein